MTSYIQIVDYILSHWQYAIIAILLLLLFIVIIIMAASNSRSPKKFEDTYSDTKSSQMSIVIDLEQKIVEKYYLYDPTHTAEVISLEEFYVRFESKYARALQSWLDHIAKVVNFNKTIRNEYLMYDNNNVRRVYFAEFENYDAENKRYFFVFRDVTDSAEILKRASKTSISSNVEEFLEKVNTIHTCNLNAYSYLVAVKFKQYQFAKKELREDYINLIEAKINASLLDMVDNEISELCFANNGTFYLYTSTNSSERRFRSNLRRKLSNKSRKYEIIPRKFSYSITLVGGYIKVDHTTKISIETALEAETAANTAMNNTNMFANRIQVYDESLRSQHELMNTKVLDVERVIENDLFSIDYIPIILTKNKIVSGYYVRYNLPMNVNMDATEFIDFVRTKSFRISFFTKLFEKLIENAENKKKILYLSFDFQDINDVMEAYYSKKEYQTLNCYFCIEFSNTTIQKYDLITIEKKIASYKENDEKLLFGITYNSLFTIYLNDKIYSQADVVLLTGQLIDNVFNEYHIESMLDIYTQVASQYNQEVIGLNVSSLAIYEIFSHYNIKKMGGPLISKYIDENNMISDRLMLQQLVEIDEKKY